MIGYVGIVVAIIGFLLTWLSGFVIIPILKKLKYGQTILDIGPRWHKNKQGTPTMGGIIFIIGILLASILGFIMLMNSNGDSTQLNYTQSVKFFAGIGLALEFAVVGFIDDYIKVVKKRNLGLTARQKTIFQLAISVAYLLTLYIAGDTSTIVIIPFLGQFNFGILYYPIAVIGIYGFVNAVNLTDGIDGLATSVTFVVAIAFMIITSILNIYGANVFATALAAGCLGFLFWNFHPAKVFMGDTGSMFLGGAVVALAFNAGLPAFLILVGIIYIIEALSVVLQVISFKTTGKRIFKMSPIHHHFEMSGWNEVKIVCVFSIVTIVFCILSILAVLML